MVCDGLPNRGLAEKDPVDTQTSGTTVTALVVAAWSILASVVPSTPREEQMKDTGSRYDAVSLGIGKPDKRPPSS
jgi:hypothetical protein